MADEFVARLPLVRDNTGFELQKFVYVQALGSSGRATQEIMFSVPDHNITA